MRAWKLLGAMLAPLVVVSAAGAAQISLGTAQQQYLADVAPLDNASEQLHAALSAQNVTSWPALRRLSAPYARELRAFDRRIAGQRWPTVAQRDIPVLVRADEGLVRLLGAPSGTMAQLNGYSVVVNRAVGLVRRDLKLPAAGTGSNG